MALFSVVVEDPTPCEVCGGSGLVVKLPLGVGAIRLCPSCNCYCGEKSTTSGGLCVKHESESFLADDAAAVRRADR